MTTDTDRLNWLEANPQIEVSHTGYYAEDPPWTAHRVSGGINDREWTKIAEGDTLREVIDAAMRAASPRRRRSDIRKEFEEARAAALATATPTTSVCTLIGPTCRGCPDCRGIGPGAGIVGTD